MQGMCPNVLCSYMSGTFEGEPGQLVALFILRGECVASHGNSSQELPFFGHKLLLLSAEKQSRHWK